MYRSMMIAATMLLTFVNAARCQESTAPKAEPPMDAPRALPPGTRTVPGSGRAAFPGVEGVISERVAPGSASPYSLEGFFRLQRANDRLGTGEMVISGEVVRLAQGTPFLVIAPNLDRPPVSSGGSGSVSMSNFAASVAAAGAAPPPRLETLEVRITDGIHKGKAMHVPVDAVALLIDAPASRKAKGAAKATLKAKPVPVPAVPLPPDESEARAAKALASAGALEKSGQSDRALAAYRIVVRDDPSAPSAARAKARIDALTGRPVK